MGTILGGSPFASLAAKLGSNDRDPHIVLILNYFAIVERNADNQRTKESRVCNYGVCPRNPFSIERNDGVPVPIPRRHR